MVRKYLETMLEKVKEQINAYDIQIEEKRNEKDCREKDIYKINIKKDLDVEYFSPRRGEKSFRERLGKLRIEVEEMNDCLKKMEEERGGLVKEKENFQLMLDEVIELEKKANVSRET